MDVPPFKRPWRMQATLQNGDAGKELDNLRLLESMGLEVTPQQSARCCAVSRYFLTCPVMITRSNFAGAVFLVQSLHREAEPEVSGGH